MTWRHPSGTCVMCRSSQPLTGIGGKREASDEKLINLYRTCGVLESASDSNDSERERFYILDARSWVAATGAFSKLKKMKCSNCVTIIVVIIVKMFFFSVHSSC